MIELHSGASASRSGQKIEQLIQLFSRLPGLGPRSARRVVFFLLNHQQSLLTQLAQSLQEIGQQIRHCSLCGNLDVAAQCWICCDPKRDDKVICVVEQIGDVWAIERASLFHGRYHILGGLLSPFTGVGPQDLRLDVLRKRIAGDNVSELILALNATVEAQATAQYLAEHLAQEKLYISELAHGLPIGGELDYLDEGTILAAFNARRPAQ